MRSPYVNAGVAGAYIVGVVLLISQFERLGDKPETILIPMAMLSLLVLSVALMGYLFFYEPLRLYMAGQQQQAIAFFGKTIATFAVFTVLITIAMVLSVNSAVPIGGDRDSHGCLIPAGYAWDEDVGACIRAFEMTPDIKAAAALAVASVGQSYALTVVSFNSYEEQGAYDIRLERGESREKETVYIRGGRVVSEP